MLEQTGILPTTLFLRNPFVPRDDWYPVKDVLLWFSGIIADILLVWRLYMVWYQKRRVLIIPCIILAIVICASVITTISECLIFIYPAQKARRLLLLHNCASPVAWIATLVNNLVCTTLIVWRLWRIARTAEGRATTRLANPAVAAFIESGGLYTGTILCMMLLIVTQMEGATYVVVPILPVVIGIAPTSIILRLNLTAHKKGSASIQNDMAFATPSATTLRLHNPKLAQLSTVEAGLDTGPEATFAKRSDFATTTCRKVPVDVTFVSSTMSSQH
ncbi:hypothetical protein FRC02_002771 [Tulasnella sp. 418]|nr:hypothetical protein FRC02_002771 [Tulasnella sp. 418]